MADDHMQAGECPDILGSQRHAQRCQSLRRLVHVIEAFGGSELRTKTLPGPVEHWIPPFALARQKFRRLMGAVAEQIILTKTQDGANYVLTVY